MIQIHSKRVDKVDMYRKPYPILGIEIRLEEAEVAFILHNKF